MNGYVDVDKLYEQKYGGNKWATNNKRQ
jgi:hypothetical protein